VLLIERSPPLPNAALRCAVTIRGNPDGASLVDWPVDYDEMGPFTLEQGGSSASPVGKTA
jgi:hypothetical protein